jgi:hypothetical protein
MGFCLVGVAACFFAAPLWARLMMDQSMVDVRAQAEKAPLVFRVRVRVGLSVVLVAVTVEHLSTSEDLSADLESVLSGHFHASQVFWKSVPNCP